MTTFAAALGVKAGRGVFKRVRVVEVDQIWRYASGE